jgi:DNA-binding NarL/FixJ family response regulator
MIKKTILIIEDNRTLRTVLKAALSSECPSMAILEATTFHEAVDIISCNDISLFLLDIQLPGGSGLDLIPNIKQSHPLAPIVVLTSHDTEEFKQHALQSGASRFLSKQNFRIRDIAHLCAC